jgi:hypothetical protein
MTHCGDCSAKIMDAPAATGALRSMQLSLAGSICCKLPRPHFVAPMEVVLRCMASFPTGVLRTMPPFRRWRLSAD